MNACAQFRWVSAALSHPGHVRSVNEDACLDLPEHGAWSIADGMGGHAVGDFASQLTIDALDHVLGQTGDTGLALRMRETRARLVSVNAQLQMEAARRQVRRIGCTVVVLIASERTCGILWAGDSRLYLYRQGLLRQLTHDHSQVEELMARGQLTPEQAHRHPAKHMITRAVGATGTLDLDEERIDPIDGDIFLLCSDGLTNDVSNEEIGAQLAAGDCRLAAERLIEMALQRGGRDNTSVVVVEAHDLACADRTQINPAL